MNLNEYLFKTSQSLMKRVLMYIDVHEYPNLTHIKENEDINYDIDDYEWAIISTLLLSSEKYLNDIEIEDYLTDEDIEKIESLLSESDEILPGDDSRQTQNCILDNDNNTVLTFDYLVNGNITDFSIDAFLGELDGFGNYYEDSIDAFPQKDELDEEKRIIQELQDLKRHIVQKQTDANNANDLIVLNGKLQTRKFVEWLRNALAHSHYVPYNEKQLRFFIKGKTSNHFNAIIDKQIVASIIAMIYSSAQLDFVANDMDDFETFEIEIKEDLENALYWHKEQKQELEIFENYYNQLKDSKDINAIIMNFIDKLNDNSYYYKKEEIIDIINGILNDSELTEEEKKNEILEYIEEIKLRIKEDEVLYDAKFSWIYQCDNLSEFEQEITDYLIHNTNFISEEELLEVLKIAKKNPNYNKNEFFNKNRIEIILGIIERKILNANNAIKILSNINEMHDKLKEKRIDVTTYKLLITSLLKCNLLDGFNMNEEETFETIDFSKIEIPVNIKQKLKAKIEKELLEELKRKQTELVGIEKGINKYEHKLLNKKVDNEYFLVKLPQMIADEKAKETDKKYEISQLIGTIDDLSKGIIHNKELNNHMMRHLRNSLAHGNVDIKFVDRDLTKTVVIFKDIDENNTLTFQCSIKLINLLEIISSDEFQEIIFKAQESNSKKTK